MNAPKTARDELSKWLTLIEQIDRYVENNQRSHPDNEQSRTRFLAAREVAQRCAADYAGEIQAQGEKFTKFGTKKTT